MSPRIKPHHRRQKRQVVGKTLDLKTIQSGAHRRNGLRPLWGPSAEFGNHRVVEGADFAPFINTRIIAHSALGLCILGPRVWRGRLSQPSRAGGRQPSAIGMHGACGHLGRGAVAGQSPRRRQKIAVRVFGVKTTFHRPALQYDRLLGEGQALPRGDANHVFYQINARHQFGDRMLHLQTRVHFQKVEIAIFIDDKFYRSGTAVAHRPRQHQSLLAHVRPRSRVKKWRWGFLDHLLVAPLN